ncbi:hypothetical protein QFC24_002739 [Naganishia onofrii]|uniref:Uncharacterized protein n=1 Tax=Naganishia onofrii TaxID=1851511 RepID=A0ACC2XRI7_9TREE|nr:hypothetical protein QFC24_002739 [Naganishia onofrii]
MTERYGRTLSKLLKQQSRNLDTEIGHQQARFASLQEKIDSLSSRFIATDECVQQQSEAVSRTASELSELSTTIAGLQQQQLLSSFTSAVFKFTKRFEDVFSDLDQHKRTMTLLEQDMADLQDRTAWMVGSSRQDRLDQLDQEVTKSTKPSQVSIRTESTTARRPAHRNSYGISPSPSGGILPPKIQYFEETSASLERRIREHERLISDWMTAMEKRFPEQQARLTEHTDDDQQHPSADISADTSSYGHLDVQEIIELLEKKFKSVVTQSKNKFDIQEARIAALEKDVYKPAQQTLPVEDRLDNLEYDVGNTTDQLKELTTQMSDTVDGIGLLRNRLDNLRLDMKNTGKKGNELIDPASLQSMKRAIGLLEEHHNSAFTKSKELEDRIADIERAVDPTGFCHVQMTTRDADTLVALDVDSKEVPNVLSVTGLGLKQQIDELKADMLGIHTQMADRLRVINLFHIQPEQAPTDTSLASSIIAADSQWDIVDCKSDSGSPTTPPTPSSFSSDIEGVAIVRLPMVEIPAVLSSTHINNGAAEGVDITPSSSFRTVSFSALQSDTGDLNDRCPARAGASAPLVFPLGSINRIDATETVCGTVESSGSMSEESNRNEMDHSAKQATVLDDEATETFEYSPKSSPSVG